MPVNVDSCISFAIKKDVIDKNKQYDLKNSNEIFDLQNLLRLKLMIFFVELKLEVPQSYIRAFRAIRYNQIRFYDEYVKDNYIIRCTNVYHNSSDPDFVGSDPEDDEILQFFLCEFGEVFTPIHLIGDDFLLLECSLNYP